MARDFSRSATWRILLGLGALLGVASAAVRSQDVLRTTADEINTTGYEDSPFVAPDGRSLYFMYTPWSTWPVFFGRPPFLRGPERVGHHINPDGNPWEDSDVYVTTLEPDGTWSPPQNLGFNDDQADCCAMTWDGLLFAYQRTQRPSTALTDLYFVQLVNDTWVRWPAGENVNSPEASESNPHLSADTTALYFTSNRAGGFGKNDLYVSWRQLGGTWSAPANLGPNFNTAENEDQIWVSRDGRTIYFNRDPGPTIMKSIRSDTGVWSVPTVVRFGSAVPPAAEASVTDDNSMIVFAQVRPELEDIVLMSSRRQANGRWGPAVPMFAR